MRSAGESTRPRVSRLGEGTLITLRCINGSTDERPSTGRHACIYGRAVNCFDPTTQSAGAGRCGERFGRGHGSDRLRGWLVDVCDALTDHSSELSSSCTIKLSTLKIISLISKFHRVDSGSAAQTINCDASRYAPQRGDVYARLASERLPWMSDDQRRRMQDIADCLGRGLDEIDACIARTGVMADEIAQVMQENLARRTYTMSLMAMVFLPSTFLTGLFGVNLVGIPAAGGNSDFQFFVFC
ncbi:CorA family divalent cation transporter [Escherichia coli]